MHIIMLHTTTTENFNAHYFSELERHSFRCRQRLLRMARPAGCRHRLPAGTQGAGTGYDRPDAHATRLSRLFPLCGKKRLQRCRHLLSRTAATCHQGLGIAEFDAEGRYICADFAGFSVVSVYLPSGSSGEERQAVKFKFMAAFMPHLNEIPMGRMRAAAPAIGWSYK